MSELARLLFPAIRWSNESGYRCEGIELDAALELGVGGFCIFGGNVDVARALTADLHTRSGTPLLIASDVERGAGQQFDGATQLPPLAALGALDDHEVTRHAAQVTAAEAMALGLNWVFAPVADVDLEPRNPIVGTRAFGTDPARVAAHVAAWVRGCRTAGALSCAKHFPGHGRTFEDSHAALPRIESTRAELEVDLGPFRAAIDAGVDGMMTAHVAYPALDASGAPATLSRPIVHELLRHELGFDGLVVTDAFIMEGVLGGGGEPEAAVRAIAAGCDVLLYPNDVAAVLAALEAADGSGIERGITAGALARITAAAARVAAAAPSVAEPAVPDPGAGEWAADVADRTLIHLRGDFWLPRRVELVEVDDDVGGPYPSPPRDTFVEGLRSAGFELSVEPGEDGATLVALYADIRAWKGRPGLTGRGQAAIARVLTERPEARVVLFGHPRLADSLAARHLLAAWGGESVMQAAAARRVATESQG